MSAIKETFMKREKYITDTEYRKCKKIASVFSILEEDDIILLDVGRYGFVALFYYTPPRGFDIVKTFTDSQERFDSLWDAWVDSQLIQYAETMRMGDIDYDKIFEILPVEKRTELQNQQEVFLKMADFKDI